MTTFTYLITCPMLDFKLTFVPIQFSFTELWKGSIWYRGLQSWRTWCSPLRRFMKVITSAVRNLAIVVVENTYEYLQGELNHYDTSAIRSSWYLNGSYWVLTQTPQRLLGLSKFGSDFARIKLNYMHTAHVLKQCFSTLFIQRPVLQHIILKRPHSAWCIVDRGISTFIELGITSSHSQSYRW